MYTGKCRCLKCGQEYDSQQMFEGCPHCKTADFVSNITPLYQLPRTDGKREAFLKMFPGNRLQDYLEVLPFQAVSYTHLTLPTIA